MPKLTLSQMQIVESVFEGLSFGIVAIDKSGAVLFSNPAASRIINLEREESPINEWMQNHGIQLMNPDGESPLLQSFSGRECSHVDVFIRNRLTASKVIWCNIDFIPLKNDLGEIAGSLLLIQDTTEQKRLADEAARSNSALQQFATVAAHDLQEPLRSIRGFSDMLVKYQAETLDEKSTRCIHKIQDGITRMQTLINDLLNYSRIQTKAQSLSEVDCNAIVASCLKSLDASIAESGAEVEVNVLPIVVGDGPQLTQLFQNLLGNALKFRAAGERPLVNVSATLQGLFWHFTITDNGIGISPEFAERVFRVFQRLHTRSTYEGTGIGLAICQSIVDRHGGRIWVESKHGEGAVFHFTLPVLEAT